MSARDSLVSRRISGILLKKPITLIGATMILSILSQDVADLGISLAPSRWSTSNDALERSEPSKDRKFCGACSQWRLAIFQGARLALCAPELYAETVAITTRSTSRNLSSTT